MAEFNYEEHREGPVESQVISRFDPGEGNISLIISGDVPATVVGDTIEVDDARLAETPYYIAGMGFRKGEYTQTLLRCYRIDVPFTVSGSTTYVPFAVDRRTVYTNWIYVWTNTPENSQIPEGGTLFVGNVWSGSVAPYAPEDGFEYSCSVAGANSSTLFTVYEHPNYRTTDRYNPVVEDAMTDATEAEGILVQTKTGANKLYVHDAHRNQGIGAAYAGQINIDSSTDSKFKRTVSFISGFNNQSSREGIQLLDLSHISYKAISASVYVDRYNILESGSLTPISKVWKDLQQGNTDESEMIFFTGQAKLEESGSTFRVKEINNRVTVPTTGSILFKIDGTNTARYTNATLFAPFLNTVYRTDDYGSVFELWNEALEEGV